MDKLETGAAAALIGIGIFQIHDVYCKHAGDLHDIRQMPSTSVDARQRVSDADVIAGGMAVLAGSAFSITTRKWYPIGIALIAFGLSSAYYHRAMQANPLSPTPMTESVHYGPER